MRNLKNDIAGEQNQSPGMRMNLTRRQMTGGLSTLALGLPLLTVLASRSNYAQAQVQQSGASTLHPFVEGSANLVCSDFARSGDFLSNMLRRLLVWFRKRLFKLLLTLAVASTTLSWAEAQTIILQVEKPVRKVHRPGTVLYRGTITNNSGNDLHTSGLFLNFSGFDPLRVKLAQVSRTSDLTIPDGTTSPILDLFTLTLAKHAHRDCYRTDVILQDEVGTLSEPVTITEILKREEREDQENDDDDEDGHEGCPLSPASPVVLSTTAPGASLIDETTLAAALPIHNVGNSTAEHVQIFSSFLSAGVLTNSVPVNLDSISAQDSVVAHFAFTGQFIADTRYRLTVNGTYAVGTITYGFSLSQTVATPESAPGSKQKMTGIGAARDVSGGGLPPQPRSDLEEANPPGSWAVPLGKFVEPTESATESTLVEAPPVSRFSALKAAPPPVVFFKNNRIGFLSGLIASQTAEPSGATSTGGVVFSTGNFWAAFSPDGANFTVFDPTTLMALQVPPGNTDSGSFCCDQVVQYVPKIDRFVWLLQYQRFLRPTDKDPTNPTGPNRIRILVASPAQLISSGATAWKQLDITSRMLGLGNNQLDFPDLSVGDNFLNISVDAAVDGIFGYRKTGLIIIQIPFSDLISPGNSFHFFFTDSADSRPAYLGHLSQNTGKEVFWAGHMDNSTLRVWSTSEDSDRYSWRDVSIPSWTNLFGLGPINQVSSKSPDGKDWLKKLRKTPHAVLGATRVFFDNGKGSRKNQIWFGWTAASGSPPCIDVVIGSSCSLTSFSFPQAHVQVVVLDADKGFTVVRSFQLYNRTFALAFPAFATNSNFEVGFSLGWGGNGKFPSHAVGFLQDFVFFNTATAQVGTDRWGDYVTIRQDGQDPSRFAAFGYGITFLPIDARFVLFGRQMLIP
jgi:hypothetical protein